jgi:ribonuclease T2
VPVRALIAAMPVCAGIARLTALALLLGLFACSDETALPAEAGQKAAAAIPVSADIPVGSGFDFYVLALSWSPAYCLIEGERANRQQCDEDRDLGFVVHGLWPQFEAGYPEFCPSREPERVPSQLGHDYIDIVPSMGLIGHQWRKHGSCSGLTQREYFDATRAAWRRIVVPDAFAPRNLPGEIDALEAEDAFIDANPQMTRAGIAVKCERGMLREISICMTSTLEFRDCEEVDRKGCRRENLDIPEPD